jgi:hypothetical protein
MPYSHFKKLTDVTKKFNLKLQTVVLFPKITPIELSQYLTICLDAAEKVGYANEKERSERLVSPILTELTLHNHASIVVYSGRDLFVDDKQGLNGECDFLISLNKKVIDELIAPVIAIVEAKEQDLRYGIAQCAAQLYGAKLFNEAEGFQMPCFYGAATTGEVWRFLKLENNTLSIDEKKYYLGQPNLLIGVLQHIIETAMADMATQ